MKKIFINKLIEQAKLDDSIYLIIADVGYGLVEPFEQEFPDRFINVGIAEQNALGICAGLASGGKKPFLYGIAPFVTFRCLDQIRMFMKYMQLPITIVGNGAGQKYKTAGYSHWAIEDEAVIKAFGIDVFTPSNEEELCLALDQSGKKPLYIRL